MIFQRTIAKAVSILLFSFLGHEACSVEPPESDHFQYIVVRQSPYAKNKAEDGFSSDDILTAYLREKKCLCRELLKFPIESPDTIKTFVLFGRAYHVSAAYVYSPSYYVLSFPKNANVDLIARELEYFEPTVEATRIFCSPPFTKFEICYANCDRSRSGGQESLTVNDFYCFMNRFIEGQDYANCDGSTGEPVLNIDDFTCFLVRYAEGCK